MQGCGPGAAENRPVKWRTVGRIEHSLLDGEKSWSPSDLRPPFATTPYHKKLRMFQARIGVEDIVWAMETRGGIVRHYRGLTIPPLTSAPEDGPTACARTAPSVL